MKLSLLLASSSLAAVLALPVQDAHAYKLYMTDGGDPAKCQAGDDSQCPQPLRWWRRETIFTLAQVTPGEFALGEVRGLVETAFDQWMEAACAGTESPQGLIPTVTFAGNSDEMKATKPSTAKAEPDNLIVFIRTTAEWTRGGNSPTWIAITKIAHDQSTGEIVDADIEINDGGFNFSIDDSPANGEVDFLSMLVHEVGHFYGLDHSLVEAATMYATYSQTASTATAARTLDADDVAGACALYTNVPERSTSTPPDDGCAGGGAMGLGVLALGGLLLQRRRRPVA